MTKPKVMDINGLYSPSGGGCRTYHEQKLHYFAHKESWDYALIAPGTHNHTVETEGGKIHFVRGFRARIRDAPQGYRLMWDAKRVRDILHQERPQIIEHETPMWETLFARQTPRGSAPVHVGFFHMEFCNAHVRAWARRLPRPLRHMAMWAAHAYQRALYKGGVAATFVPSSTIKDQLAQSGIPGAIVVPLGVNVDLFDPQKRDKKLRLEWGVGPRDRALLHAGRLTTDKGTALVIAAAETLMEDPSVHLVFAGHGGLVPRIEDLARSTGRVHYLGYISDPTELGKVFASSDLYLGTGPNETFGLSILEALAAGLPIVVADAGAAPELAQKSGAGECFHTNDPRSLATTVQKLLRQDHQELGRKARRFALEKGSWQRTFDILTGHYEHLLEERR